MKLLFRKLFKLFKNKHYKLTDNKIDWSRLDKLISKVESDRDVEAIPELFYYLLSHDNSTKVKVTKTLFKTVSKLSLSQLIMLDRIFRERTSMEWSYDWKNEDPTVLLIDNITEEEKCCILGIASFHPNGYFREKAVEELARINNSKELTYLLIRYNDWVYQVRSRTEDALLDRYTYKNIKNIIDNLPLLFRLERLGRHDNSKVLKMAFNIIKRISSDDIIYGLESNETEVRYYCYKILIDAKAISSSYTLKLIMKETNPYTRIRSLNAIKKDISYKDFDNIKDELKNDNYFAVRVIYLELLNKFTEINVEALKDSLLDGHISVRETARFLLKENITCYSKFYKNALNNNVKIYGAIQGLGETGRDEDSKYIFRFLEHKRSKIVQVTIKALIRLNTDIDVIMPYLNDERQGISKTVRHLICKNRILVDSDKLYNMYKCSTMFHVKKNTAILLCRLDKWAALNYIIEICSSSDILISSIGKNALSKWFIFFNKSFTVPSNKQIIRIKNSLERFGPYINEEDIEALLFILKPYNN